MTTERNQGLEQVYAATNPEELNVGYRHWASDYDRDTFSLGYHLPLTVGGFVARHLAVDAGPILDAGAGTGLTGKTLQILGYKELDGLDLSPDMLALARANGIYRRLEEAELGKALPFETDAYAAFVSTGVFTEGHAPVSGFDELIRVTRPGGLGIFMTRGTYWDEPFGDRMRELESEGKWTLLEKSEPFRAFFLAEPEVTSLAFVYRINT